MLAPRIGVEIVHEIAAADDEHALVPKWRQLPADLKMERRGLGLVDAELHDGNVGSRINVSQHGPCTVIEAPGIIELHGQRRQKLLNPAGECGIARRRVLNLIEFLRKTAEVVNGARRRRDGDARLGHIPVR